MALTCLELGHPRNQLWTKNILYLTSYCMLGLDLLLFLLNSRSSDRPVLRSKAPVFMPALQVKNLACLSLPGCGGLSKVKGPQGQHPQRGMASPSLETWLTASNCLWKYFFKECLVKVAGLCIRFCFITDTDKPAGFPSICWYLTDPGGAAAEDETLGVWRGPDEDDKSLCALI